MRKSYTTNNQKGTVSILDDKYIKLPKIGKVKAVIHRQPEADWILKSATVSQERDGTFYISVLFAFEKNILPVAKSDCAIGLDYKSDGLYMDSNGNIGSKHKYYRESEKKLAKEQRRLSRRIGSKKNRTKFKNYLKQLQKINKIHRHIANQNDIVCVESLDMKAMAKTISDCMENGRKPRIKMFS